MGKRRVVRHVPLQKKDDERSTKNAGIKLESSPTDWLSSIQQHQPIPDSLPKLEVNLNKLGSDCLVDSNFQTDNLSNNGLKTSNFYGSKNLSFPFTLRKTPDSVSKQLMDKDPVKKNTQHKGKNLKRKHKSPKNSKISPLKRPKKGEDILIGITNSANGIDDALIHGSCNGFVFEKNQCRNIADEKCDSGTILDMITPEPSPSENGSLSPYSQNGEDMDFSHKSQATATSSTENHVLKHHKADILSDLGSVHSEDSLISGHGSIYSGALIKGDNGEYYFSNSTASSPDLTQNGPSQFFNTPSSSRNSPESDVSSLGRKDKPVFFFGKDSDESSYAPSCNSSNKSISPECQTSITSFFKTSTQHGANAKSKKVERSKRSNKDKKMEQMYLDLGQRNFGHVTCTTCGMVYTHAQPDDEVEHIRHHKKFVNGLRFNGWKDEHVVKEYSDGRVIMVKPDDHPSHQKKAEEIRKVVDSELGFAVDLPYRKHESKTFLFITNKRVVGCCVATQIDKGYPVLPSTPNKDSTPDRQIAAWCCSTVPVPAQCGISKIWVWNQYRRKKVATRLIECVRTHFIYGCVISKDVLAFSDPTPDGKRLATAYCGTAEFLVFH